MKSKRLYTHAPLLVISLKNLNVQFGFFVYENLATITNLAFFFLKDLASNILWPGKSEDDTYCKEAPAFLHKMSINNTLKKKVYCAYFSFTSNYFYKRKRKGDF